MRFVSLLDRRSGHMGLQPSSTQLSHLLAAARASGELKQLPCMALRYTQLAAERGIASAAAALAYAYTTGVLCVSRGQEARRAMIKPHAQPAVITVGTMNHTRSFDAM
jgi:hypothetical protein